MQNSVKKENAEIREQLSKYIRKQMLPKNTFKVSKTL